MADATKYAPINGVGGTLISDFRTLVSLPRTKRTAAFAYAFIFAFIAFTVLLAFTPSSNSSSPWFTNIFSSTSTSSATSRAAIFSDESYRSHFSSIFSYFFPNSTQQFHKFPVPTPTTDTPRSQNTTLQSPNLYKDPPIVGNQTIADKVEVLKPNQSTVQATESAVNKKPSIVNNQTPGKDMHGKVETLKPNQRSFQAPQSANREPSLVKNQSPDKQLDGKVEVLKPNQSTVQAPKSSNVAIQPSMVNKEPSTVKNQTQDKDLQSKVEALNTNQSVVIQAPKATMPANQTVDSAPKSSSQGQNIAGSADKNLAKKGSLSNFTSSILRKQRNESNSGVSAKPGTENMVESLMKCNLFDGNWVRDDSYPMYKPGSCSLIDEQFNCLQNGRPDEGFQKLRWKPKACTIPRMNGGHMLELLRGKRLVFVGDSLNRNMWESLICILRNSVKNQKKVYEKSGRHHFRTEASYIFVFEDYNCTVEFFVSPFLVQEWETADKNGAQKETLRLDLIGNSADQYKNADIIIFNTGHWWTHEKTSKGKDYYQEGSHVYNELNVLEAFRKALTTWARWVDANVNPTRTQVFFRGYSASHFSGGQWNSGGQCDHETEPIKNETYLSGYPLKMEVLERVVKGMKTPVSYLNVTRMTDYRKDGHPSIYRKQNLTEEERRSPLRFQDCSHWCLPGVPDAWNEILYAEILIRHYQKQQQQKRP